MPYNTHLTFIDAIAKQSPEKLCFKCAELDGDDEVPHCKIIGWKDITYGQFYRDLQQCAKYWLKTLRAPPGSIIGVWLLGATYRDTVNLFALQLAKYVPQIFNLKIRSPEAATYHFNLSNITHVIHAPSASIDELRNKFKLHRVVDIEELSLHHLTSGRDDFDLAPSSPDEDGEDIIIYHHTSGSTAGRPKLIRQTRKWVDGNARKTIPGLTKDTDIALQINGLAHASQFLVSIQQFRTGACIVLVPWIDFTPAELIQIITECNTNIVYQLTPVLCRALREAMTNSHLEELLRSLDFIVHGGAAITDNERLWAMERGISFRNIYGSTEMGINMASIHHPLTLHPFPESGLVYEFWPVSKPSENDPDLNSSSAILYEMVISPASLDCPHPLQCNPVDKHYHSRDLFEKVEPSGYKYRGRLDDMIQMSRGQNCDALYIENQMSILCKDLVQICVVVGSLKPSPAVLVELVEGQTNSRIVRNELGQKVHTINQYGFPHERILPRQVLVVPSGALPRTPKGNINRKITEEMFRKEIDGLYEE